MKITEFGKAVRKARIDASVTLGDMAEALEVSPPFLSAMETGRKKISEDWVRTIDGYFRVRGIFIEDLETKADVANKSISLDGLSPKKQLFTASFARKSISDEQIDKLMKFIDQLDGN